MLKLIQSLLNLNVGLTSRIRAIQAFDEGNAYFRAGKFDEAVPLLKESAELGYAYGMAMYATALTLGQGVAEDGKQAVAWLELALQKEGGVRGAKGTLGMLLATGKGNAPVDLPRARQLLESAVYEEGDTQAADMLAMMDKGIGIFAKTRPGVRQASFSDRGGRSRSRR